MSEGPKPAYDPLRDPEFLQGRSLFIEDWAAVVQPTRDAAQASIGHSVTYGSTALQAGYLINGGALAALPPLLTSLTNARAASVALAAIPFVLGISATAISSLMSYLNFQWHAQIHQHDANGLAVVLKRFYQKASDPDPDAKERVKLERRIQISFYVGVAAGVLSLVFFVCGAFVFIGLAQTSAK